MTVDRQAMKDALSKWASGVSVVTTIDEHGNPKGMTASSFSSVSLDPPRILVCLSRSLYTHQLITQSQVFAVNILHTEQALWGKLFAGMMPEVEDRFAVTGHEPAVTGSPILPGVLGWVDCRVDQAVDVGDHTIFIGEVLAASGNGDGVPLVYAARQWGQFTVLEAK